MKLPFQSPPFPPGLVIALVFPAYSKLLLVWNEKKKRKLRSVQVDDFANRQNKSRGICRECNESAFTDEFCFNQDYVTEWKETAKKFHLPESIIGHDVWKLSCPQNKPKENGF